MRRFHKTIVAASLFALLAGCPAITEPLATIPVLEQGEQPLEQLVRTTLETNRRNRTLSVTQHGAWQILHGVLAYGADFPVQTPDGTVTTLEYLKSGGTIRGFEPRLADRFRTSENETTRGVRFEIDPTSKVGQGHRDQWLAIFSQCDLPPETELPVQGAPTRLLDWVRQAEFDVPLNLENEFSWTLIGLTAHHPTDHSWRARDGETYSTELLLASELEQDLITAACGGTHRLIGIAMTVAARQREGAPMTSTWQAAREYLDEAIALAKQNQNPDGTYSTAYLHRTGWTRDLGESIGTTGHILEFLSIAADDETLRQPWVERSVRKLCEMLESCNDIDLECGILYHALHGLVLYEKRLATPLGT